MKLQSAVKKELIHISCGTLICTVAMWLVFAVLGLFTTIKLDSSVLLGGALGALVAIANFVALGITVQQIASMPTPRAKGIMQISYNLRLVLQAAWCVFAMQWSAVHFIAAALPLLFPRVAIFYLQKIGAFKPEASAAPQAQVQDPEGVFADDEGGEN